MVGEIVMVAMKSQVFTSNDSCQRNWMIGWERACAVQMTVGDFPGKIDKLPNHVTNEVNTCWLQCTSALCLKLQLPLLIDFDVIFTMKGATEDTHT